MLHPKMAPKCRKMAPRSFQEPSWPLLVALGPLLGLLRAILGRLVAIWGPSEGDLGAILVVLAQSWALWDRSWGVIGGSWGDLGRPRGGCSGRLAAAFARSGAPPRDFLRKFLPSRDLKNKRKQEMFTMGSQHAVLRWGRRIYT